MEDRINPRVMEVYGLFRTLVPESQRANWDLLAHVNLSAALVPSDWNNGKVTLSECPGISAD
jgi:hypothetical protein